MEVKLDKRYPVAARTEQAWAVLADIRATAACMPGAQITEQLDETHFKGTVKTKIGPAAMTFLGDVELQGLDAAARELRLMAKGADKAGSSATMQLQAHVEPGATDADCVLVGQATVTVSGKLAQFGNRLLVPVSDALLAQFADNFRAAAQAVPAPGAVSAVAAVEPTTVVRMVEGGQAPSPVGPTPTASPAPPAPRQVKELNALALMWQVFKNWLARLFGRAN